MDVLGNGVYIFITFHFGAENPCNRCKLASVISFVVHTPYKNGGVE